MKIGFLSDAHGNYDAFLKGINVLNKSGVEKIFFLGDAIGYFDNADVVIFLEENKIISILGNHEDMVIKKNVPDDREPFYRLKQHFDTFIVPIISKWPISLDFKFNNRMIRIVHGSLKDPVWGYTHNACNVELDPEYDLLVCGATHRPFVANNNDQIIANIGSCGFPRDIGNLGSCGVYNSNNHSFDIIRFDIKDSIDILRTTHHGLHELVTKVWDRKS